LGGLKAGEFFLDLAAKIEQFFAAVAFFGLPSTVLQDDNLNDNEYINGGKTGPTIYTEKLDEHVRKWEAKLVPATVEQRFDAIIMRF
jgi:hypothetical protein